MTKAHLSWFLSSLILLLFSITKNTVLVDGQCLNDQRSHLWHFKNSLEFDLENSRRLWQWNLEEDCCSWRGVACDAAGRVTTLELDHESITGAADNFTSLFKLQFLEKLNLAGNNFNNVSIPKAIENLTNLVNLNLSHSGFFGQIPMELSSLRKLVSLDLSTDYLNPLKLRNPTLKMLIQNLSNIEELYLDRVDLSAQRSEWSQVIATSLPKLRILSLRKCDISGPISLSTNHNLSVIRFSGNSLTGLIPSSICGLRGLAFLDMSYNALIGRIPSCLVSSGRLEVLNLADNKLTGSIPDTFPADCNMKTLDLGMNKLLGKLPRTLSNCTMLELLNLGNNKIEDVFPCMFENSSSLHVLILQFNKFHGEPKCFGHNYSWPRLQIIDIASNNFSGVLSSRFFSSFKNMLTLDLDQEDNKDIYLGIRFGKPYYQFKVQVTMKGQEIKLEKILTIFFRAIDFSNNKFSGKITKSIGDLMALYVLDLSHNEIIGRIPSSIGKLSNLGLLDLSSNQLTGEIPSSLNDLSFLSYLDLSFNMLTGKIPTGPQLQTFSNDSYIGNVGLCGFPLSVSCGDACDTGSSGMPMLSNKKEINDLYIYAFVSVGYTVGLVIFSIFLLFCASWRNKLFLQIDKLQVKLFGPMWREPIRRL